MIQLTLSFSSSLVDDVDDHLLEAGDVRWMVSHDLPSARATLIGVFEDQNQAHRAWAELRANYTALAELGEPTVHQLTDQDWRDSYKAHFKSWHFGRLHWVPEWERQSYVAPPGHTVLWLDPGLAFGTGNHETTRLCCERLIALSATADLSLPVIDAGCGSGILALSAARLGFRYVSGFDNDPEAIQVSRENAVVNDLADQVHFFVGDIVSGLKDRSAGLIFANIQADVLMRFASELLQSVNTGGALVLSGILASEIDQVRKVFKGVAPTWHSESRVLGEWADLLMLHR